MKVIQINASYKPAFIYGGPTMSVSKLAEVLVAKKINLEVLTTQANGNNELNVITGKQVSIDNVPVTYYKRISKDHTHFSPALLMAFFLKLKNAKFKTIIHIHAWWNLVSIFSCAIAVFTKFPVVLSPRGTLSSYSFGNRNNLIKKIIHNYISIPLIKKCHIHATSENEKNALSKLLNFKSITVIPNLVNIPNTVPARCINHVNQGKIRLLFFSRIEQKKGLEFLFAALKKTEIEYTLTIAGSGERNYISTLKELSKSFNIDHNLAWIGEQTADKKFVIMADHHILVLPSHDENFANVVVESLAVGTAVVITENVGLSDYVFANDFGWVCKMEESALKTSLQLATNTPEKLIRISQVAPTKIRSDFSDDLIANQFIDMYTTILKDV